MPEVDFNENSIVDNILSAPVVQKNMDTERIKISFKDNREFRMAKDQYTAKTFDNFMALALTIRDKLIGHWIMTQQRYHRENLKRVYYLSMEFLIGRLMENNILNLGIKEEVKHAIKDLGFNLEELYQQEVDAGLGNGGLGRLAACFLDSMATLGIPAHGYGIRYDYGIFHQKIVNGHQREIPDEWLKLGNPWEIAKPEYAVKIRFYGRTQTIHDLSGNIITQWVETEDVLAMPYDMPIPGYENEIINTLRLWSAHSTEEFDLDYFNHGDYEKAVYKKAMSENISKVLYPNDIINQGKELRLKQEYFLVASSISDIIRRFKKENKDFTNFSDKVAIQINDTHPSLAIVELMRILVDEEKLCWDSAWDITVKTFAYTNHTVMPEALETWSVDLLGKLLPRHLELIYEINQRFLDFVKKQYPKDTDRIRKVSLIEEGDCKKVRMAYLAIIGSHSTNGVSEIHSELLKTDLFKNFYELFPERFNNKTNGITQRRWLMVANHKLSNLISEALGSDSWSKNLYKLEELMKFRNNDSFRHKWMQVKLENKKNLANYIHKATGILVDPNSLFDVQVKRIHEYKRQLLFCLYIIREYLKIKNKPNTQVVSRTFILGGKASPGYVMAKLIIKFINNVAQVINNDKSINDKLKVVFLENYRVSLAEKIFPGSDLSEQISTAGTEASGTGCMKFMLNGALTICTPDGANLEMAKAVGMDNIFMFGMDKEIIQALTLCGYEPSKYIKKSAMLSEIIRLMKEDYFSVNEPAIFLPIIDNLWNKDPFIVCADFDVYCTMQDFVSNLYKNQDIWVKKSIINVAKSGRFSSDSTISEYARKIWNVPISLKEEQNV